MDSIDETIKTLIKDQEEKHEKMVQTFSELSCQQQITLDKLGSTLTDLQKKVGEGVNS